MSHGDRVISLPEGFEVFGRSEGAPFAIFGDAERRKMYGIMFHPEVVHTPDGARLLHNFVHGIAGIEADWTMAAYKDQAVAGDPRAGRQRPRHLRPVGRRRFLRRRRADP